MSSLHARLKSIRSIATEKKWKHQFFRHSRAANSSKSSDLAHPSFNTCSHYLQVSKVGIKNNQETVETPFPHFNSMGIFFRLSRVDNSIVGGPI